MAAEAQTSASALASVAFEGSDLASLLQKEFKPKTDDLREAPSRVLIEKLWEAGAEVRAYDPAAMSEMRRIYGERPELTLCAQAMQTLPGADALVIMTEWQEFRSPDFDALRKSLTAPVIFDGRNLYDPALLAKQGFQYYAVGRGLRPS